MSASHGQNPIGGGTVSNCLQFIPLLVWNLEELLWACLESQYIELCEATSCAAGLPRTMVAEVTVLIEGPFSSRIKEVHEPSSLTRRLRKTTSCSISALLYS